MKFQLLINVEIVKNCGKFRFKTRQLVFILLINVKMPTIVGSLTFMNRINFNLSCVEHEKKSFITSGPDVNIFLLCIVDGGKTCILRCGRAAPEFEGRGLMKLLLRHVGRWGYSSGAQTVLSLAHKIPASKSGTTFKIIYTWRWNEVTCTPDKHIRWAMM